MFFFYLALKKVKILTLFLTIFFILIDYQLFTNILETIGFNKKHLLKVINNYKKLFVVKVGCKNV